MKVGIGSAKEVRAAYDELLAKAQAGRPHRRASRACSCREMVTGGVETLIGVSQDELFGPVVTIGLGGIFVEVFGDVTFRVPPFDDGEARRALQRAQGLQAARGRARRRSRPTSTRSSTSIMKVQRLAMDLAGDVRELDINPLVVRPRGAVALDALVVKR